MEQKKEGKVWLVGAGPSDAELLTLKAKRVLEQAEVVVYDRLVGESILLMMPEAAEKIDAGKRSGNHTMPQEQMNELLLKKAQEGKCVVRLKGGDPFLFGRGGEELELLAKHNIPFEVVPGVTSAISVPAYNGIPVTHRDYASSVHIITGHKKKDEPLNLDFTTLAKLEGTLVFLMGVSALTDICQGLCNGGKAKETPAALLSRGTTAKQRRIVSTLEKLPEEVKKNPMETPAVIVVGEVCGLSDEFNWYEKLTLFGKKIIVTRPRERSRALAERLRSLGAEVLELPSIRTVALDEQTELWQAFDRMDTYQWIAFTSPTGAEIFFEELKNAHKDIRSLAGVHIAAIGQGTAKVLEERGILVDLIPEIYDGDSLGEALAAKLTGGEKVLLPRAGKGNENLVKILKTHGARVDDIATYDTVYEKSRLINIGEEIRTGSIDCVVFTSASTVKGFVESTGLADYSGVVAACIGKQTKAAADAYGMQTYVAEKATIEDLIDLVVKIKNK